MSDFPRTLEFLTGKRGLKSWKDMPGDSTLSSYQSLSRPVAITLFSESLSCVSCLPSDRGVQKDMKHVPPTPPNVIKVESIPRPGQSVEVGLELGHVSRLASGLHLQPFVVFMVVCGEIGGRVGEEAEKIAYSGCTYDKQTYFSWCVKDLKLLPSS